jgi:hypothetical protein
MKIFGRVQTGLLGVACVGSCAGFASLRVIPMRRVG